MATLSWRSEAPPPARALVFASEFRAPTWRILVGMLRGVRGITEQLRAADGSLGYALQAQPLRRRLTTVSAWRDDEAMRAFVGAEPHRTVMRGFGGRLGTPTFVSRWEAWADVRFDADHYVRASTATEEAA